uniref:Uncharacterized protein n=1 Tax=Solanum lycopersicum TaxID=4081 RepID=A0A3Q7IVW3_SOLLC
MGFSILPRISPRFTGRRSTRMSQSLPGKSYTFGWSRFGILTSPVHFGISYVVILNVDGMMNPTHETFKTRMATVPDPFLKVWWSFMNNDDKIIIQKHIGYLLSMLEMNETKSKYRSPKSYNMGFRQKRKTVIG